MSAQLTHILGNSISLTFDGRPLFRYVYAPTTAPTETPKPYLHPLRTLAGNLVTNFRPHDHLWHTGIAMTFAHLSGQNFWGGPTYVHGKGYTQLPNNGRIHHQAWEEVACEGDTVRLRERLTWISYEGQPWLDEQRTLGVREINARDGYWTLEHTSQLRNVRGEPLVFGSPTTVGRPLAGYGSLMWRGPRSFLGGTILAGDNQEGPEMMGKRAPWLAYIGKQDGTDGRDGTTGGGASTLIFVDQPTNPRYPNKWFIRNDPFAAVSFAVTFDEALTLAPGEELSLSYRIIIADGAWTREQIEQHA